jgi:hypothetical protein
MPVRSGWGACSICRGGNGGIFRTPSSADVLALHGGWKQSGNFRFFAAAPPSAVLVSSFPAHERDWELPKHWKPFQCSCFGRSGGPETIWKLWEPLRYNGSQRITCFTPSRSRQIPCTATGSKESHIFSVSCEALVLVIPLATSSAVATPCDWMTAWKSVATQRFPKNHTLYTSGLLARYLALQLVLKNHKFLVLLVRFW